MPHQARACSMHPQKPHPRKLGVVTRVLLDAGLTRDDFEVEQGRFSPVVRARFQDDAKLAVAAAALRDAPGMIDVTVNATLQWVTVRP